MSDSNLSIQSIPKGLQSSSTDVAADARLKPNKVVEVDNSGGKIPPASAVPEARVDPVGDLARIEKIEDRSLYVAKESFSIDRVREMVQELEKALPKVSNSLSFSVDDVLNRPVITVTDKNTGEVLRTLPSDEVLRVVHNIDKMRGIIFEGKS
jgi:flagellar protein FlaG